MQMKCVCRSWKTLISDPFFIKLHLKKQSTRNTTHFALLHRDKFHSSLSVVSIPVSHLRECRSLPIAHSNYPYYQLGSKFSCTIVGSCNGLICLQSYDSLYLWNPATRTQSQPLCSYHKPLYKYWVAFGYDNSTDTYKVVVLSFKIEFNRIEDNQVSPTVRVLTFGDNIWKDIQSFPVVILNGLTCSNEQSGVYLNNSVNWLVRCPYYCHLKNVTIKRFVIISLDLGTETYTQFLLPRCWEAPKPLSHSTSLCVLMDCLCFSYNFEKSNFDLWQMKKFGVEESWTQFLKIRNLNLQVRIYGINDFRLTPLCLYEDGDILIFAINCREEAIYYDWRNNRVMRIINTKKMFYTAKGYSESLVSTC
ncbi:unnamed protein product [Trifolium pratense]|uniref:Uncharacterized protein n=1 Tax=Trifolium pratense TaxID=57577 RepID=A0ACB0LK82_TRIPR|nr:unnamed protein product [Trifolium pratense]